MPFTLSHAVLAPPLAKLSGNRLPIAALAIGTMTPDLYRLFTQENSNTTHLWSSLIHPDLWIGLAFCFLWYVIYRPALYRFIGLRHALNLDGFVSLLKFTLAICFAVILGTATHLIWDGLTHADFRTFAFKDTLSQDIALFGQSYPLHRILQISTSFIALPILFWMCWRYYQNFQQCVPVHFKIKRFAFSLSFISLGAGAFQAWQLMSSPAGLLWRSDLYEITGRLLNQFTQGSLLMFSLGCILFLILDRGHRMG